MSLKSLIFRNADPVPGRRSYSDAEPAVPGFTTPAERIIEQLTKDLLDAQHFIAKLQQIQRESEDQIQELRRLGDYKEAHDRLLDEVEKSKEELSSLSRQLSDTQASLSATEASTAAAMSQRGEEVASMRRRASQAEAELEAARQAAAAQQAELDRLARRLLEAQAVARAREEAEQAAAKGHRKGNKSSPDTPERVEGLQRSLSEARAALSAAENGVAARDARIERLEAARQRNLSRIVELKAALAAVKGNSSSQVDGGSGGDSGSSSSSGPSVSSSVSMRLHAAPKPKHVRFDSSSSIGGGSAGAAAAVAAALASEDAEDSAALRARIQLLMQELATCRGREAALAAQVESQATALRENSELVETGRQRVLQVLETLSAEGRNMESQRVAKEAELEQARQSQAQAEAELEIERRESKELRQRLEEQQRQYTESEHQDSVAHLREKINHLTQELAAREATIVALEAELRKERLRAAGLADELEALQAKMDQLQARLAEEQIALAAQSGIDTTTTTTGSTHDNPLVTPPGIDDNNDLPIISATPAPATPGKPEDVRSRSSTTTLEEERRPASSAVSRLEGLLSARDAEVRRLLTMIEELRRGRHGMLSLPRGEAPETHDSLREKLAEQASSYEALLAAYTDLQTRIKALRLELDEALGGKRRGETDLKAERIRCHALESDLAAARAAKERVEVMLVQLEPEPQAVLEAAATSTIWLQTECQRLGEENAALEARIAAAQEELEASANLLGHSNPNQKIQYYQRIKLEGELLRRECATLTREKFNLEQCIRYLAVLSSQPEAAHLAVDAMGLNPRAAAAAILPSSLAGEQRYRAAAVGVTSPRTVSREASGPIRPPSRETSGVVMAPPSPRAEDSLSDPVEAKVLRLIARVCRATKITVPQELPESSQTQLTDDAGLNEGLD